MIDQETKDLLERIAGALERLAPEPTPEASLDDADAFVWHSAGGLEAVPNVNRVDIGLLRALTASRTC